MTAPSRLRPAGTWACRDSADALAPGTSVPLGSPALLPFGGQATAVSVTRTGRMVQATQFRDTEFRTLSLANPSKAPEAANLADSTFDEETPDYSSDGRWLVFASTRSGAEQIWIAQADGSNPRQMTSMGGAQCANPQWSPDGTRVLFNSRARGSADLYVLRAATGELARLTSDPGSGWHSRTTSSPWCNPSSIAPAAI